MSIDDERFEIATTTRSNAGPEGSTHELLRGSTLIVPCVSIGSVPQLAVDALLATAEADSTTDVIHVCDLDHRFCVPFAGAGPSGSSSSQQLRTPLQVFVIPSRKLTVIQQRSPILKARKSDYVQALQRWINSHDFAEVVVMASLDAGMRTDEQMGPAFWHLPATGKSASANTPLAKALAAQLPRYGRAETSSTPLILPPLPAGGLVRRYLSAAAEDEKGSPPSSALILFAAEGDNRADGLAMAQLVLTSLASPQSQSIVREPDDWRLVFGESVSDGLF